MVKARVSANTKATNMMVMQLCTRDWEECIFIPKREVEIEGKEWRTVDRGGSRGGRPGATWAAWSLKKLLAVGWVKELLRREL